MPQRDSAPNGAPCWIDLFTTDPDTSQAFYNELFGWTSESAGDEYGGYVNFAKDGLPVAGAMKNDGASGQPDTWSVYLASAAADTTVAAVADNGGMVYVEPMDVMELGKMAIVADPGGATIGVWQPGLHKGFAVLGEPGTPNWFELHARNYEATVAFYERVFGWETEVMSDAPELRYTTLGSGDDALAGVMDATDLAEGQPAAWVIYFGTADTDATVAQAIELGGAVVEAAENSPYGRLAVVTDPTGAQFRLMGPNN